MTVPSRWWLKRGVLVALGAIVALVLTEGALRILGLPDTARLVLAAEPGENEAFVADPGCFWRLAPGPDTNAEGLRGPWFAPRKAANEFRILAVGDSCTYGFGVAWEDTWAVRLERLVQAARPTDVVSAGLAALPGYSVFQDRRLLERVLPNVRPDVVVLQCGAWNDFVPTAGTSDLELAEQLVGSRLVLLARSLLQPGLAHYRAMIERGDAPNGRRVPIDDFERLLLEMIATSRAAGANVVLVAPSHPASTLVHWPGLVAYRERVLAVGARERVPVVDLADVVKSLDPDGATPPPGAPDACFLDWVHPARNLHDALGRAVAAQLALPPSAAVRSGDVPRLDVRAGRVLLAAKDRADTTVHRAWLGDRRAATQNDRGDLIVTLPDGMPPGRHVLQLVSEHGARTIGAVELPHLPIRATTTESALVFSGEGRAGRVAALWVATARAEPVTTPFGEFGLAISAIRREIAGVHRFDLAVGDRYASEVRADGTWSVAVPRNVARATNGEVHAQALLVDRESGRGALTEVVTVR